MANNRLAFQKNNFYHVYNRGYMKHQLFYNQYDYEQFISYVDKFLPLFPTIKIYIYCILPNHFHFLLQQLDNWLIISEFMRKVQVSYANYYKAKYPKDRWIPMFEWRFCAKHIETTEYLLECYNYILYNPTKHQLVENITNRPYLFPMRPVA